MDIVIFVIFQSLHAILTWLLFNKKVRVWRQMVIAAWLGFMTISIAPYVASVWFFIALHPLIVFGFEVAVEELMNFKHRFDAAPRIGEIKGDWKRVAAARSSNGYHTSQFYPAAICDFGPDDAFWPDHVSTVYLIELRQRCMVWKTYTIWQVSLLTGGKKKIHKFNNVVTVTDGNPFAMFGITYSKRTHCFQSGGVLFVAARPYDILFVYDTKCKKSTVYKLQVPRFEDFFPGFTISFSCSQRLFNMDGSVRGWRIRWLDVALRKEAAEDSTRACLINEVYELQENGRLISSENIVRRLGTIRASRGYVGVVALMSPVTGHPIMFFDETVKEYVYFANIADLRRQDSRIGAYASMPMPMEGLNMCLVIFNDREAVLCYPNGAVFRAEFRPSTLKYSAAKAFLRSNPGVRNRMSANEFRSLTGIERMDGHFG